MIVVIHVVYYNRKSLDLLANLHSYQCFYREQSRVLTRHLLH